VLVEQAGRTLLLEAGKMGFVYVLDASTGVLVRRSEAFVSQKNLFLARPWRASCLRQGRREERTGRRRPTLRSRTCFMSSGSTGPLSSRAKPCLNRTGESYISVAVNARRGRRRAGLSAINPSTGQIAWQVKGDPLWSGALVTAGGVVFAGDVGGRYRAYDAGTGQRLWEFDAGVGVNAPGVSYELDGEQFIVVAAGGSRYSRTRGSTIIVFGLGAGTP
jgi:outer membrane protein assembly factor BamB